ncbi:MAG: GNAT family N-acetyltransferase [Pirellulales bacterium]
MNYVLADLAIPDDAAAVRTLLNAYASDPYGDGHPLDEDVLRELIPGLRAHPTTEILLAKLDAADGDSAAVGRAVGIAICFRGFSTFAARPLLNIHDFFVLPEMRGRGVGPGLMAAVEAHARTLGCCKLTLEVQENNRTAQSLYERAGFRQATYVAEAGGQLFLSKKLG